MSRTFLRSLNVMLIIIVLILGYALIETGYAFLQYDASLQKSTFDKNTGSHAPLVLISYADGPEVFYRNQRALANSAMTRGVDFVLNYQRAHIAPEFIAKNRHIFAHKKGAGYWLWKPWIINQTLKTMPEGTRVIYADVGFVMKGSLKPLLNRLNKADIVLSEYENVRVYGRQKHATTRAVFKKLNADRPEVWNDTRVLGGFMILRNSPKSRAFIGEWLRHCQDPLLLTDADDGYEQLAEFKSHHHDQSILSVMASLRKDIPRIGYDTHLANTNLVWHHRRSGAKTGDTGFIWTMLSHHYAHKLPKRLRQIYNWIACKLYS